MDVVRSKTHWPCSKNDEQSLALREYTTKYKNDKNYTVNYLESFIRNTCTNSSIPNRQKHKDPNVSRETLIKLVGVVTTCLEKSYATKNSFKNVYQPINQLMSIV